MISGFVDLKQKLKHSLHNTWKNALVYDWIPEEDAKALSLSDYYVGLKWTKKEIALNNYKQNMNSIFDLFDKPLHMKIPNFFIDEKQKPMKIFIEGEWVLVYGYINITQSHFICVFWLAIGSSCLPVISFVSVPHEHSTLIFVPMAIEFFSILNQKIHLIRLIRL